MTCYVNYMSLCLSGKPMFLAGHFQQVCTVRILKARLCSWPCMFCAGAGSRPGNSISSVSAVRFAIWLRAPDTYWYSAVMPDCA